MNQLITQFGDHQVIAFFLVLARVSPLFLFAPLFSSKLVPLRVRGIVAVALTIGLSPVVSRTAVLPADAWGIGGLIAKELLVGAAFAFTIGAVFAAVSVAGSFLDTLIGFSFGATLDPISGNQSTVLTQLYSLLAILIFIAIGGDAWVIRGLAGTYDVVGIDQAPALTTLVGGAAAAFGAIFGSAVQVAAPLLLTLVVTDAAFGMVSRVVPQLNVFGVGFPVKIVVGLVMLGVTLPFAAGWLTGEVQRSVAQALQTLRVA